MRRFLLFTISVSIAYCAFAQNENAYRSKGNPLYWKNRMPDKAYWQQDVHYNINAKINEETNVVEGDETLDYWNNSPDTLHYVFFHLWQNAFVKGSHLHSLEEAQKQKARMGKYERQGKGIELEGITADGAAVTTELDNTILKIYLPKPLYPGAKVSFKMGFKTYYDNGSTRRRMQMWDAWGYKHYNGVQWFPKICVYDRKFGWDTHQHLNKEFYADFGSYDVALDFASNYVVEATGELQNRKDVLPDDLRARLDVKNFANKKWEEKPSEITPYVKGERKVWKYKAMNVHDFAFTADPSYRISTSYWNGIECVSLVQEPHASGWKTSGELVAKIIKTFSEDIGMYQYPKMVAADARDGMEYPMLTLDGGKDPDYHGLLVHEIGHNWFYGMIGNNETYRASLDEGFTQFLTSWGLRRLDGDHMVQSKPKSKYRQKHTEPVITMDRNVLNAYTVDALNRNELPINTHSDDFHNALGHEGGYRLVYYKTASMLYNLQYTLGDSVFIAALRHYFDQWRFAHPYFEDLRNSFIQYTHNDLNWFFDQWMETTKTIDYKVYGVQKIHGTDSFAIKFRRNGEMQMPIDFTVTAKDGNKYSFYIPNTWYSKTTAAVTLPKWYGWGKMHETYTAHVAVPSGVKKVQIDTTYRLADAYMPDNVKTGFTLLPYHAKLKWDAGIAQPTDRRNYRMWLRPDLWWNPVDGIKAGLHVEGDYLNTMHRIDGTVWFNTHLLQRDAYIVSSTEGQYERYIPVNYSFNYASPLMRTIPKLQLQLNSRVLDGLNYHRGGVSWLPSDNNMIELYAQTMWRQLNHDRDYLIYPNEWSGKKANPNSSINIAWSHNYSYVNGAGTYKLSARAPFLGGANPFSYAYAQLEAINYNKWKKLEIRTRLFGRYGTGNNIPYESALFIAGANPEELMDNKYTRSTGFLPDSWENISSTEMNHFQQGGGLNLRGYAGYFVADERNKEVLIAYKGRSGISGNIEVDFDNYISLKPKFLKNILHVDAYAFADAGYMELSHVPSIGKYWELTPAKMWSDLRVDAGVGFAFTIKNWGVFDKAKPLTLRFDMPLFVNRPPFANPDYTAFRYVVGVNRSF